MAHVRPDRPLHVVKTVTGFAIVEPTPAPYSTSPVVDVELLELSEGELGAILDDGAALQQAYQHPDVQKALAAANAANTAQVVAEKAAVNAKSAAATAAAAINVVAASMPPVVPPVTVVPVVPAPPVVVPVVVQPMTSGNMAIPASHTL